MSSDIHHVASDLKDRISELRNQVTELKVKLENNDEDIEKIETNVEELYQLVKGGSSRDTKGLLTRVTGLESKVDTIMKLVWMAVMGIAASIGTDVWNSLYR